MCHSTTCNILQTQSRGTLRATQGEKEKTVTQMRELKVHRKKKRKKAKKRRKAKNYVRGQTKKMCRKIIQS